MKQLFGNCLEAIPLIPLAIVGVLLGLAPFAPEPHLVEKLRMLVQGDLHKPIDIFDLFLHGVPPLLLAAKLACLGLRAARKP